MSRLRRIITFMGVSAPVSTSFRFTVITDNSGLSDPNQFIIPTTGDGYNYNVVTSEQSLTGQTGNVTLSWSTPGTYEVEITGDFPRIYFNNSGDKLKITEINAWGNIIWTSFQGAFFGCSNLDVTAPDVPNLSSVSDLSVCFGLCNNLENNNGSISNWNVSNVTNMRFLFSNSPFNQDIGGWTVSNVTNMIGVFSGNSVFNQDISNWDVSNVTTMVDMFSDTIFNQNISSWDVSSVTNMSSMFLRSSVFNQPINSWDVSSVNNMSSMFHSAGFNQPINSWNVSNVTDMSLMFVDNQLFDQNIGGWTVSSVNNMSGMFSNSTAFNGDISSWNVSSVTNMSQMFQESRFNQDISSWNVSSVTNMSQMFAGNQFFDQLLNFDPTGWTGTAFTSGGVNMDGMFSDTTSVSAMSLENYTDTLVSFANIVKNNGGWLTNVLENQVGRSFDDSRGGGDNFEFASDARNYLLDIFGDLTTDWGPGSEWAITGDTVV
jgi:surface protein